MRNDDNEHHAPAIPPNERWCEKNSGSTVRLTYPDGEYIVEIGVEKGVEEQEK